MARRAAIPRQHDVIHDSWSVSPDEDSRNASTDASTIATDDNQSQQIRTAFATFLIHHGAK
jgi:hypothetical protein